MSTTRVAAIDCGTNSIRLLAADVDPVAGTLTELDRRMEIVRLGQGVDRTGRLATDALDRTLAACERYAGVVRDLGITRVRMVATSATRDAANASEFVQGVHGVLGVDPEVVEGAEEAALSYLGATRELAGRDDLAWPFLAVDIGGGSTEFVRASEGGAVRARSVDVGSVRLTERHLADDPPLAAQVESASRDIDAAIALADEAVGLSDAGTLLGLAGTVTTLGGIALDLPAYDSARIHHSRMPAARVHEITRDLLRMSHAERAANAVIHPGRVDVIGAGALILDRIVSYTGVPEVLVSEHDILDGIAWSLVDQERRHNVESDITRP
ncbi:MAG: exopolyphosphatase [Streptosporangiales bacterium]